MKNNLSGNFLKQFFFLFQFMENPRFDLPKNTWRRFDTPRRQRCQGLGDGTQSRGPASPRKKPKRGNPRNDEFDRSDRKTSYILYLKYDS